MPPPAARRAAAVFALAVLAGSVAGAQPSPELPHTPAAFDDGKGDEGGMPGIFFQLGCRNRTREFWGIAQIGLLDTRSVDFNGLVQLSLDHNADRTTIGAAQIALANYSYELYGLFQVRGERTVDELFQ